MRYSIEITMFEQQCITQLYFTLQSFTLGLLIKDTGMIDDDRFQPRIVSEEDTLCPSHVTGIL